MSNMIKFTNVSVSRQSSLSWWKTCNWLGRQCCFPVVWSVVHYKRQNFKNIKTLEYLKAEKVMTSPTLNQILVEKIIMTNPLSLEEKKFWFLPLLWSFWLFLAVCTPFWSLDKDAVPEFLFFWGPPEKSEDFCQDFIFNTWWLKDFRKNVSIHSDAKLYDPLQEGGLDMEQSGAGGQKWQLYQELREGSASHLSPGLKHCCSSGLQPPFGGLVQGRH